MPTAERSILGFANGRGIVLADVSGDGVLEFVGSAMQAHIGVSAGAGAIYAWKGGATLIATPALLCQLTVPGAITGDQLGN